MARASLFPAVIAFLLAAPHAALGFECTPVTSCPSGDFECLEASEAELTQAWNQRCIPFYVRSGDGLFGTPEGRALLARAFARWTSDLDCTDFEVLLLGRTPTSAGFDNREPALQQNVIHGVRTATEAAAFFGGRPSLLAVTLTSFSVVTGEIFDADILFNDFANPFDEVDGTLACAARNPSPFDVENTLVHEIGHVFGFDHVSDPRATMFEEAARCEVIKRDLEPDDIAAMCTTYASGAPPRTCRPPASYDEGPGDPSIFRRQCEREITCADAEDVQACKEDFVGVSGCGCHAVATRGSEASALGWGLLVAAVLGARIRRRSPEHRKP